MGTNTNIQADGIDRVMTGSVSHYCLTRVRCPLVAVPPTPAKAVTGAAIETPKSAGAV